MAEHTPIPWRLVDYDNAIGERSYRVERVEPTQYYPAGPFHHLICDDEPYYNTAPSRGDAAFIVKAVNAHEMLVEALKAARRLVPDTLPNELVVDQINAALRLANGDHP